MGALRHGREGRGRLRTTTWLWEAISHWAMRRHKSSSVSRGSAPTAGGLHTAHHGVPLPVRAWRPTARGRQHVVALVMWRRQHLPALPGPVNDADSFIRGSRVPLADMYRAETVPAGKQKQIGDPHDRDVLRQQCVGLTQCSLLETTDNNIIVIGSRW